MIQWWIAASTDVTKFSESDSEIGDLVGLIALLEISNDQEN